MSSFHLIPELLAGAQNVHNYQDIKQENEHLREQIKLLKLNMQQMFETQTKSQEELDYLRKVQSKGALAFSLFIIPFKFLNRI